MGILISQFMTPLILMFKVQGPFFFAWYDHFNVVCSVLQIL